MKKIARFGVAIAIVAVLAVVAFQLTTSNERISRKFAENLFQYPLPPGTTVLGKHQFNAKNLIESGSGGYWNVVAIMELSSSLSREDIIAFYKDVEPFPFPKGEPRGVELELYFAGEARKVEGANYFHYRDQLTGSARMISSYRAEPAFIETSEASGESSGETNYTLQLFSGFDYFFNID
ncbi:hypothetical protein ACX93W_18865 [Paenibacillus sp. CAU 1782]